MGTAPRVTNRHIPFPLCVPSRTGINNWLHVLLLLCGVVCVCVCVFSAHAADLHSLWGVYKNRHKFRALGDLHIAKEGFAYWTWHSSLVPVQGSYSHRNQLPRQPYHPCG